MPVIVGQDGKKYNLSEEQIVKALQSSQWWEGSGRVALVSPQGKVIGEEFSPERIRKALQLGFRFEQPAEELDRYREEKYGDSPITAGLMGAADAASLGIVPWIVSEAGGREFAKETAERNESAYTAGEILGTVGPALATGGASAAAQGGRGVVQTTGRGLARKALASTPAGLLTRGAEATRGALTRAFGESALGRGAAAGIAYGGEGAIYGLGSAVSEAALQDKPLTSESLLAHAGMGALLGGGLGGGLTGLGALGGKVKGLAKGLRKSKGAGIADEITPGFMDKIGGIITGEDPTLIAKMASKSREGKLLRRIINEGPEAREGLAYEIADLLTDSYHQMRKVSELSREEKWKMINRIVKRGTEDRAVAASGVVRNQLKNELDNLAEAGRGHFEYQWQINKVRDTFKAMDERLEAQIAKGEDINTAVFMELDTFKKDLGRIRERMLSGGYSSTSPQFATADIFEKSYEFVRQFLENKPLFGKAASAQKAINKEWAPYLSKMAATSKRRLYRVAGKEDWTKVLEADTGGVRSLIDVLDSAAGREDFGNLLAQLKLRQKLAEAHAKHYPIMSKHADAVDALRENTLKIEKLLGKAQDVVRVQDAYARIAGKGVSGSQLVGAGAGGLVGYATLGPAGAVALGAAGTGMLNPALRIKIRGVIDRATKGINKSIDKKISKFFEATGKAQVKHAAVGTATKLVKPKKDESKQEEYRRVRDKISAFATQPEELYNRLSRNLGPLMEDSPEIGSHLALAAARATRHLQETMPKAAKADMYDVIRRKDKDIPERELNTWFRRLAVGENPTKVLDSLADGTLTKEEIDTLKAVYPRLYQKITEKIIEHVAKNKDDIGYNKKVQLSMLLGQPLDSTLRPEFIAQIQANYLTQPSEQSQAQTPLRVTGAEKITLGDRMQTRTGSLEAKKAQA